MHEKLHMKSWRVKSKKWNVENKMYTNTCPASQKNLQKNISQYVLIRVATENEFWNSLTFLFNYKCIIFDYKR